MTTYIALFRGVNVGGNKVLPMKELARLLEDLGLHGVRTYLQSGNAVFRSKERDAASLASALSAAVEKQRGFAPHVLLLSLPDLERAVAANPFPEAASEPQTLHLYFLASAPAEPDLSALERLRSERERFALEGSVFYLHAPDGVGRSKLAASAEKLLGVAATARNWRTVGQVLTLARQSRA